MTPEQEQIAENLIAEMKRQKGSINWKPFRDKNNVDATEMVLIIKALKELEIIENFHGDTTVIRLTERKGSTFPGFEAQRQLDIKNKEQKEKTEEIDFKKKSWEYKYRKLPYLFSGLAFVCAVLSIIISYKLLTKKPIQQDLQPMQQQIQVLQDRVKLIDSLYQVDTLRKKYNQ